MSGRHRRARLLLGGPATLINSKSTWTFGSPLGAVYVLAGKAEKLNEEIEQMDECMPATTGCPEGTAPGAELIMRAEAHLHRGETDEAEFVIAPSSPPTVSARTLFAQRGAFIAKGFGPAAWDREFWRTALRLRETGSYRNTEDLCRYTYDLARAISPCWENRRK